MKQVTPKYKLLECKHIIDNPTKYSKESYVKAKEIYNNWIEKIEDAGNNVTNEQRNELKNKYKNLY